MIAGCRPATGGMLQVLYSTPRNSPEYIQPHHTPLEISLPYPDKSGIEDVLSGERSLTGFQPFLVGIVVLYLRRCRRLNWVRPSAC